MSYVHYDHAGWVERQIPCARPSRKARADNTRGWAAAPEKLSEFQAKVFDIIGMALGGIHNAPVCWDTVQWRGDGRGIGVPIKSWFSLSTFDSAALTTLVFLCHEARIRLDILPNGPRGFLLRFHPRAKWSGGYDGHPNLDEAVAKFRAYLPAGHRVVFTEDPTPDPSSPLTTEPRT